MLDKQGRNIDYLRISVTDLCNLRCRYCMPEEGMVKKGHDNILRNEEIEEIVKVSSKLGIKKVRITGGEPLIRKGIIELIRSISNIKEIKDIAMTTNGILLKDYAYDLKNAGLNRVNISIDSVNEEKYKFITRGGSLEKVFEGIEAAQEAGLTPIKLNIVLIGGFNDDEIENFVNLTLYHDIDVRFIELMPIGGASQWAKQKFIPNEIVLQKFPELMAVYKKDKGSPASYYKLPNSKGRVGLINPISHLFCSECNRIRVTADGGLKPCLHSNEEINIKEVLNQRDLLEERLVYGIKSKPKEHQINELGYEPIERNMYQIGG